MSLERLTKLQIKRTDKYYMKCSETCPDDCEEICDCEEFDGFVNRLGSIEDILGADYDLNRLRELVEADRAGRCVVLPVLPALRPGTCGSEIYILLDSGEIVEDCVNDILIGLNSRGEMNLIFSTFDSGDFETADVGKRIFWDVEAAQQAASSLKGEPPC